MTLDEKLDLLEIKTCTDKLLLSSPSWPIVPVPTNTKDSAWKCGESWEGKAGMRRSNEARLHGHGEQKNVTTNSLFSLVKLMPNTYLVLATTRGGSGEVKNRWPLGRSLVVYFQKNKLLWLWISICAFMTSI